MKAVQFKSFGGPEVLELLDLPDPVASDGTAVVRIESASINPSDVKNVQGAMHQTTLPRVPGRDYSGVVVDGPEEWKGAEVWGTGGDVGFTRDGTHAQLVAVPVESLRRKPKNLDFDQASTVGVNYMAAWLGVDASGLEKGETMAIIGAGGGVGGAASLIAKRLGAKVIGIDKFDPQPQAYIREVAEKLIIGVDDVAAEVKKATGGKGADVVFDMVGGPMFAPALGCLALRGRMVCIASVGSKEVTFNLVDFYHNESRLFGVDTLKRDLVESAKVLEALNPGFEDGSYKPAPISLTFPLNQVVDGYKVVSAGSRGRVLLHPQE